MIEYENLKKSIVLLLRVLLLTVVVCCVENRPRDAIVFVPGAFHTYTLSYGS